MDKEKIYRFLELSRLFSTPHPWHGIFMGDNAPEMVKVYIEIVPGDTMKYELDKESGFLKIDRPQRFSSICPVPYGFIPQTLCGDLVGRFCMEKTGRTNIIGDNDPIDICVLTERNIPHGNIIMDAMPIGGFRMLDGDEADDKIIAVMKGDPLFGELRDIEDAPDQLIERLSHYFLTYKQMPDGTEKRQCEITHVYGSDEAQEVIQLSAQDYSNRFNSRKNELFSMIQNGLKI